MEQGWIEGETHDDGAVRSPQVGRKRLPRRSKTWAGGLPTGAGGLRVPACRHFASPSRSASATERAGLKWKGYRFPQTVLLPTISSQETPSESSTALRCHRFGRLVTRPADNTPCAPEQLPHDLEMPMHLPHEVLGVPGWTLRTRGGRTPFRTRAQKQQRQNQQQ